MDTLEHLSITCPSGNMLSSLISGAKWLKSVSEVISAPVKSKPCKLTDAEEMLAEYQVFLFLHCPPICACWNLKLPHAHLELLY